MRKLGYTIVTYNGNGGYSVDSGQFDVKTQSELNRALALLERTCARGKSTLDVELFGPFDRDCVLPPKYVRVGL